MRWAAPRLITTEFGDAPAGAGAAGGDRYRGFANFDVKLR